MKTGVHVLEQTLRDTQGWVSSAAARLNARSRNVALASLKATLHAIREQLEPADIVELGQHLPLPLRGLYYDGWDPARVRRPATTRASFLERIEDDAWRMPRIKAARAAKAALETIFERVPASVMVRVIDRLPEDLRALWPDEPAPYIDLRASRPVPDPEATRRSRASPSRLGRATRRAPGQVTRNALPERHVSAKKGRRRMH